VSRSLDCEKVGSNALKSDHFEIAKKRHPHFLSCPEFELVKDIDCLPWTTG
jgi:hypothetical protein